MQKQGISPAVAAMIAIEVGSRFDFRLSRAGDRYRVVRKPEGRILDFRYAMSTTDAVYLRWERGRYVVERVTAADGPVTPTVFVNVNAHPWASIEIDGSPVGETPLAGVPVPSGRHRIGARFPDGSTIERVVEIDSGHRRFVLP